MTKKLDTISPPVGIGAIYKFPLPAKKTKHARSNTMPLAQLTTDDRQLITVSPTGLQYLRARYYNTGIGRFTTRDTWAGDYSDPLSLNRWMYVKGNPVMYTDPSGHVAWGENEDDICLPSQPCYSDYYGANDSFEERVASFALSNYPMFDSEDWEMQTCTAFAYTAYSYGIYGYQYGDSWDWRSDIDYGLYPNNEAINVNANFAYMVNTNGYGVINIRNSWEGGKDRGKLVDDANFMNYLRENPTAIQAGDMVYFNTNNHLTDYDYTHMGIVIGNAYDPETKMVAPLVVDANGSIDEQPHFIYATTNPKIFNVTVIDVDSHIDPNTWFDPEENEFYTTPYKELE